jgi:hypothetical protein
MQDQITRGGSKNMAVDEGTPFVVFRASNGEFVSAEGGGGREVVANRPAIGPWEVWQAEWTGTDVHAGITSLIAYNGEFMCAEGGGGQEVVANRPWHGPWETFTFQARWVKPRGLPTTGKLDPAAFDQVGFQVANGMYISADGGGGGNVYANRGWWAAWETFDIFPAPDEIIAANPGRWHLTN